MFDARAPKRSRWSRASARIQLLVSFAGPILAVGLAAPLGAAVSPLAPPSEPDVRPLIASRYAQDADQDRIADGLFARAQPFEALQKNLEAITGQSRPKAEMGVTVEVELIFDR